MAVQAGMPVARVIFEHLGFAILQLWHAPIYQEASWLESPGGPPCHQETTKDLTEQPEATCDALRQTPELHSTVCNPHSPICRHSPDAQGGAGAGGTQSLSPVACRMEPLPGTLGPARPGARVQLETGYYGMAPVTAMCSSI